MASNKRAARIAGLWYVLMAVTGAFSLLYVPSRIIVAGDAAQTADHIAASGSLLRLGAVSSLISNVFFIFLVLTLYQLFKEVSKAQARLMVIFVLASIPIAFVNVLIQMAPLALLSGSGFLKVFEPAQLNALVMVFLQLHEYGTMILEVFWGLWLFPFGYLVYKSGIIPKVLGVLLMINCLAYIIDSFVYILTPGIHGLVSKFTMAPMAAGEILVILWLLIMGAKDGKLPSIEAGVIG